MQKGRTASRYYDNTTDTDKIKYVIKMYSRDGEISSFCKRYEENNQSCHMTSKSKES